MAGKRDALRLVLILGWTACGGASGVDPSAGTGDARAQTSGLPGAVAPNSMSGAKPSSGVENATAASPGSGHVSSEDPIVPTTPMAGSSVPPGASSSASPSTGTAPARGMLAMDECALDTPWPGDEYCIQAPPPDKGFQLHIGPSNYANPEAKYLLQPGQEVTETFQATSGNDREVYYYYRQYRMRPGSHHMIVATAGPNGQRLGGSQNLAKDNPDLGVIAPENQGVGMKLAANTPLSVNLHYINQTSEPILKEVWVNFWYRDPAEVTEPSHEMFSGAPMNIAPGQHVLVRGECPITSAGRILQLYGHRHANNRRFSVMRLHAGQEDLVYEDYDWEEPLFLEFSSAVQNAASDRANHVAGGWSGVLEVVPGDKLAFECEITNDTDKIFVGRNEAIDDEMCIMVGDTAGTTIPQACAVTTTKL